MGFFSKLLSPSHKYESVGILVSLVRRLRIDLGQDGMDDLSALHARNDEFMGELLGIIDHLASRRGEPTQQVVGLVVRELFGRNTEVAVATISSGASRPTLMNAMELVQEQLANAKSADEAGEVVRAIDRFF